MAVTVDRDVLRQGPRPRSPHSPMMALLVRPSQGGANKARIRLAAPGYDAIRHAARVLLALGQSLTPRRRASEPMPSPSRRKPAAQSALAGFDNRIVKKRAAAMTVRASATRR
jgi:hypothetical protein